MSLLHFPSISQTKDHFRFNHLRQVSLGPLFQLPRNLTTCISKNQSMRDEKLILLSDLHVYMSALYHLRFGAHLTVKSFCTQFYGDKKTL